MTSRVLCSGSQQRLHLEDPSQAGECRRVALRLAQAHALDATSAGRVGIVATELATNVLRHAGRGEFLVQTLGEGADVEIEMLAIDRGPGVEDVERCLRDGYSTGGTGGTGLGAIARLSSTFDMHSVPGRGTIVLSRIGNDDTRRLREPRHWSTSVQVGAVSVAVRGEIECGDAWCVADRGPDLTLLVVDGLGHGPLAAAAARTAVQAFCEQPSEAPVGIMQRLHRVLSGSRGGAAASAVADATAATVHYAGVGNIAGSLVSAGRSRGMISHNGTLGVRLLRTQQFEYEWPAGASIVMHSDGLSARWSLDAQDGLQRRHPAVIAAALYRDHARERDDVTVLVAGRRA